MGPLSVVAQHERQVNVVGGKAQDDQPTTPIGDAGMDGSGNPGNLPFFLGGFPPAARSSSTRPCFLLPQEAAFATGGHFPTQFSTGTPCSPMKDLHLTVRSQISR